MLLARFSRIPRSLAVGVCAIAFSGAWSGAGCSPTKPTEIVPGALSQIEVPKNLAGIKIQILANGSTKFNQSYLAQNGVAFLPATLGIVSGGSAETTVTVLLAGYNAAGVMGQEFTDDSQSITEVGQTSTSPRVRRGSIQTYVDQHTLFLPMPLSYACWGNDCSQGGNSSDTCKANACVTSNTDATLLSDFDPSMVDGTQDCFSPSTCFAPQTTSSAVLIDAGSCLYEVPPGQNAGDGLNVRIIYQDMQLVANSVTGTNVPEIVPTSEQEILNVESSTALQEGFVVPDPSKPLQFKLASGLCDLVKATTTPPAGIALMTKYHTISAVQVSTACPSKPPLLPVCATEQNPPTIESDGGTTTNVVCNQPITLDPAPSAIYMVMDDSSVMAGAFGSQGYATAMGLSLSNPVFKRTYVAFEFLDHTQGDCAASSTPYTKPGKNGVAHSIDFTLANVAQPSIGTFLLDPMPMPPDTHVDAGPGAVAAGTYDGLYLQTAMSLQTGAFKHLQDFSSSLGEPLQIGAAMFFLNRQPDSTGSGDAGAGGMVPLGDDCVPALDTAKDSNAQTALEQQIVLADKAGLQSYFVILNNGISGITGTPLQYFKTIQTNVKSQGVKTTVVLDATQPKTQIASVLASFSDTVTALGTCLYERPPGVDTNGTLGFTLPIPTPFSSIAPALVKVPYDAKCNAGTADTENGWNIEPSTGGIDHIRICGTSSGQYCWELRQSVLAVTAEVLSSSDAGTSADAGSPPVPEVPVSVTMPCTPGM
jgi:hypothetical protein